MNLELLAPEIVVLLFGMAGLLLGVAGVPRRVVTRLGVLGLLIAAALTVALIGAPGNIAAAGGMMVKDDLALMFGLLFLGSTLLVMLASGGKGRLTGALPPEYEPLLLFACAGMMFMAAAAELITIYLSLELTGIALSVLVGLRRDARSSEAGLKFLLLGGLSSAVVLYGMVILYGLTGSTNLQSLAAVLAQNGTQNHEAVVLATALLVAGFGFKLASVPFHMWVPDVYEGAPTPVTAFLSVASKAAGFAVVLRLFHVGLGGAAFAAGWTVMFGALSMVSMTLGNLVAVQQRNIKRMMGYSSIAQAGYLMIGLAVAPQAGVNGIMFFLVSYAVTNLGAFIAIIAITEQMGSEDIRDFGGVFQRSPLLAVGLALCMLSLTGIPPTAGFFGKLFLFSAGVQNGLAWVVLLGVVNSAVSAYYYLGVVKALFAGSARPDSGVTVGPGLGLAFGIAVVGTLVLGLLPGPILTAATAAARGIFP